MGRMLRDPGYEMGAVEVRARSDLSARLCAARGTIRAGTFHPLTSTTGVAAPCIVKCAVRVSASPGHSVTSLSLHKIGSTGWPCADCLIDTCSNSATVLDDVGTD